LAVQTPDVVRLVQGVCPVLEVPFHEDGQIDVEGFGRVVRHVLMTGVSAVMFPGFASEFAKLADCERDALCRVLLDHTTKRADVAAIVSVPDHSTHLAVQRACAAVEAGADMINVLPPYQLSPPRREVLAHVQAVLSAVAPTPVVLQYAPTQTGTALDAQMICRLASDHDNLRLVKVESQPPGALIDALRTGEPSVASLVGYGGIQVIDAVRRGAVGVQPGCSFVELYVDLWSHLARGQWNAAQDLHRRLLPYLSYWMQSVELIVAAEKLISYRRGMFATPVCRAPAYRLDADEVEMIERFLEEFGPRLLRVVA
jgi:4-hydroxy-tetrahydrodipicolinate synthase